jgi:hypothetical protein
MSTPARFFPVLTKRANASIVKGMTMEWAGPGTESPGVAESRGRSPNWGAIVSKMAKVLANLEPVPEALEPLESALRELVLWASDRGRMHLSLRAQTVVRGIRQHSSHDLADALPKLIRELEHTAWSLRSDPDSA